MKPPREQVGIDIVEVERIQQAKNTWQNRFLERIYTEDERNLSSSIPGLAGRFAAKEAVMKALGTGTRGIGWREINILAGESGAPCVQLNGRAAQKARELGITDIAISISHERKYAVAFAVCHVE